MFTTPCFINKNTPELRREIKRLGYIVSAYSQCDGDSIFVYNIPNETPRFLETEYKCLSIICKGAIDCGTNEELFLAIATLRDDSDIHQWFCDNSIPKQWFKCRYNKIKSYIDIEKFGIPNGGAENYHKATVKELIEHFNNI